MDDERQSHSSLPLVSRLDRLDSIMKYLEVKQNISRSRSHNSVGRMERRCMPLDLAVGQSHSKGSLLDRVASLEDRLVQLCLEIEASHISHSTVQTSSSSHGTNRDLSFPSPTFNNPNHEYKRQPRVHINRFAFQGKSRKLQQRAEHTSPTKQQLGNNGDEKTCKSGKKGMPPSWPHLKILGC
ncbi:hypothetical protein F0562_012630 [Nyssa sinensis]|uniref:Uncharacterized protein n=1 Tax=Nyssa sinensis TaxID=561372 RepID=A0A5J4ZW83_9ASTE|nr:hypothetical protein F0562_012630 [Nyssa sinensis]